MFNLEEENKNAIVLLVVSIIAIMLSGLFFGFVYFMFAQVQTGLEAVDCDLPEETGYADCQAWFTDTIYNFLNLKTVLITWSYIFIFTLVLGLFIVGYKSGSNPVFMGIYFLVILILTYAGILLSNLYRTLISNSIVYDMMQPFTIYNKVMLNFPWFVGIIGLFALSLSVVNFQQTRVNTPTEDLDY